MTWGKDLTRKQGLTTASPLPMPTPALKSTDNLRMIAGLRFWRGAFYALTASGAFWMILIVLMTGFCGIARATVVVDLEAIKQIESSGGVHLIGDDGDSLGSFQISSVCLKEYNQFHKLKFSPHDRLKPEVSRQIADWYLNVRIPQMVRHFTKHEATVRDVLVAYNAGISYVAKGLEIPATTKRYLEKYTRITGEEL